MNPNGARVVPSPGTGRLDLSRRPITTIDPL
jgi:hypothetical protein